MAYFCQQLKDIQILFKQLKNKKNDICLYKNGNLLRCCFSSCYLNTTFFHLSNPNEEFQDGDISLLPVPDAFNSLPSADLRDFQHIFAGFFFCAGSFLHGHSRTLLRAREDFALASRL